MGEDEMIYLLISFILGWIIARMMGEGFSVGAKKKKHMHCKKHRHNCKQRCNADCNEEMLTCQESKYDDNDNLLGASSYSRQDCCDRIRTHVRLDCEDNYNDGLKEYCSSETIQYKYDECMRTGKFPKFASCK